MPRRERALPLPTLPTFRPVPNQAIPGPYRPEDLVTPPTPPRRITLEEYRQLVNDTLAQPFGALPGQAPPKPKPVAKPTGRQVNVRLGDLMKVYSFETGTIKCKLIDFRVPLIGEYILTKHSAEGTKIRKCTMGNVREPRMIFEVVE